MSRFEKIRDVLNIIVTIAVGVCTVIVTIFANKIANTANEIAQMQALISKNSVAPTIVVAYKPWEEQDDPFLIEISILDGKYNNFESEPVSFLTFITSGYDENNIWVEQNRVEIPMTLYSSLMSNSRILYGNLESWSGHYSESQVESFFHVCEDYYEKNRQIEKDVLQVSIITCLRCSYLNLLGEKEDIYPKIPKNYTQVTP